MVEKKIQKDLLEISDDIKEITTTNDIKKHNRVRNISCLAADENANQSLWLNIGISSNNTFVDNE